MPPPSQELLDEIYARFILNVPQEGLETTERMMFVVEEAYWAYEDFYREADPSLSKLSLREFTRLVFEKCPGMEVYQHTSDEIYDSFVAFKQSVPVMGAIMLDPTLNYVLLLRGFKNNAYWSFPRGKIGKDETDSACAIREVFEETGVDISGALVEEDFIEVCTGEQRCKLYIIPDVPLSTEFAPQTRGEVGAYAWHELKDLPSTKEEFANYQFVSEDGKRHRFFMLWPFLKRLKSYIKQRRKNIRAGKQVRKGEIKPPPLAGGPIPQPVCAQEGERESHGKRRGKSKKKDDNAAAAVQDEAVEAETPEPDDPHVAEIAHRSVGPSAWMSFQLDEMAVLRKLQEAW